MNHLLPELNFNRCHIAPEWENGTGQKLWFVSAPYGGTVLRFTGEPTSLLYAIAPLVAEIKKGRIRDLSMGQVALLNPIAASENLYYEIKDRLRRQNLRAICISALTASSPQARAIANLAKEVNPDIITIFGGPHEDDIRLRTAVNPAFADLVDFSVTGDGEYSLLELARIIFDNPGADVNRIKDLVVENEPTFRNCQGRGGISFLHKGETHQLYLNGQKPILNDLPLMPRELLHEFDTRSFSIFKHAGQSIKTAQIMTHRGCAWRCSFCSESAALNTRSVESVINEIEEIRNFSTKNPGLAREDYRAIFFDDSTFTHRSSKRKEFLRELYAYLKYSGLEWGCQTRLDQIDKESLTLMKDAGCTYVFTGLESASEEMLRAMSKDERRRDIERAFEAVNAVGIRLGLSLVFGVAEPGSSATRETNKTILETLDLVENQTRNGNIVLVTPNLATYYPDTRMTHKSGTQIDFTEPIVNRGYPWNRFEEGEGHHPEGLTKGMASFILRECIERFGEYLVSQDLYSIDEYKDAYRSEALDRDGRVYTDLNCASIGRPMRDARTAAEQIADMREISTRDRIHRLEVAREVAASLMGVPKERAQNIVMARNTTEAASLAFWLSGLHLKGENAHVLTTNAENMSVPRAFRFHMDHGNSAGRDLWSSYQDYGVQKSDNYEIVKTSTRVNVEEIKVTHDTARMEELILKQVTNKTNLVIFCHVIRDDGRVCDVKRLCKRIREINPEVYILVDGAQALGALPKVQVEDLGCDFYVAAPHKTLGSFPLGLLYMSDRAKANLKDLPSQRSVNGVLRCLVLDGMFDPRLNVKPTGNEQLSLPEVVGFSTAVTSLTRESLIFDNDCSRLNERRRDLKRLFINGLQGIGNVEITSPLDAQHSDFILTFRFPGLDNRMIAEGLWRNDLVFLSYIARSNVVRVSFGPITRRKEVDQALRAIQEEVIEVRVPKAKQETSKVSVLV
jgi:selenocysteine lyase/cysteine desulfurase/radical SAM superfamily enzyme YgiQ (UPF0313 family)